MARALGSTVDGLRNSSLLRFSLSFIRTLSTSSPSSSAAAADTNKPKKSKRKKKNLFEVAQFLPTWGIGYHMAKTHWKEITYEITKINLYKVCFIIILFFTFVCFHQNSTIFHAYFTTMPGISTSFLMNYRVSFLFVIFFPGWETWQGMGHCS